MNVSELPFLGEAACLVSAALWASAVTLFRPSIERYGAQSINFAKCALAAVLQGLTVWLLGLSPAWWALSLAGWGWIAASGVVGLVVGDTALFTAVRSIGVQRTLLLQTLAPLFAALLGWAGLGEVPRLMQAAGGLVILGGIALVVSPRRSGGGAPLAVAGIVMATLAALGQAGGIVLAKIGMREIPALPASSLRLMVAAVGLGVVLMIRGRTPRLMALVKDRLLLRSVLPATMLGTYLAMFLFMAGVALAPSAVAAVLIGTTPVFSLIIDAVLHRRMPDRRSVIGTLLAVAGVAILSVG